MSYKVIPIPNFEKESKALVKKFPSLKEELNSLIGDLSLNPNQGVSLGGSFYKIRLKIKSKGKGKSGGARVITAIISKSEVVYLLSIYDKSEFDSISNEFLNFLFLEFSTDKL